MKSITALFLFFIVLSQSLAFAENERIEFVIWPTTENQENPDIYGDIVVWQEYISAYGDYDILAADINDLGKPPFLHVNFASDQKNPVIFENYIAWQDLFHRQTGSDWDIHMTDISEPNMTDYTVTNYSNNNETNPAIHGNIIVWEDGSSGEPNMNIYGADVTIPANPREFLITGLNRYYLVYFVTSGDI